MTELNRIIVRILASKTNLNTSLLYEEVSKNKKTTLANVYRSLQQLQDRMIVQKKGTTLGLNSSWVIDFLQLAETMKQNYIEDIPEVMKLKQGEIITLKRSSFFDIDGIRSDMIGKLIVAYGKKESIVFYNAHQYHLLATPDTEVPFFKRIIDSGHPVILLIGGETTLDKYCVGLLDSLGVDSIATKKHPFKQKGYYVNIIGDYVLEFVMPPSVNQYLELMMETTINMEQFNPAMMKQTLLMKEEYKLIIRKDGNHAKTLKEAILKIINKKN